MANSKYQYVRKFEESPALLRNTWIVVRVDGRGFSKFTKAHQYKKPNDQRGVDLMCKCGAEVVRQFSDIVMAYGQSDEFSFVFRPDSTLYARRADKIQSTVVALFAASFVFFWPSCFPDQTLLHPPAFDARCVCYPSEENIKDYIRWRQVDCHINNLFNTTFWALVQRGGMTGEEAERELCGTVSADKNEIMFSRFGINYNNEPLVHRRGTLLARVYPREADGTLPRHAKKPRRKGPRGEDAKAAAVHPASGSGNGSGTAPSEGGDTTGSVVEAHVATSSTAVAQRTGTAPAAGAGAGAGAGTSVGGSAAPGVHERGRTTKKRKWRRKDLVVKRLYDNVVPEKFWKQYPELLARK